ncbi:MAG TPA: Rieske (2Fe-2S) protein [Candidatus Dormibacteraeota bacterium]|nr:Rieske (2Fe-2S) protein [Candidatus Dormibacteraeota bacterium]
MEIEIRARGHVRGRTARRRGVLNAIGAVCSHAGGPLDEGKLEGDCVECPWHGSRFLISDGRVRGGPARFGQPPLVVREQHGKVEVKLAHPLH